MPSDGIFCTVVISTVNKVVGVVCAVIDPIGDVVRPLFHILSSTPALFQWPGTKLIGNNAVSNLIFTSFTVVDDGVPLVSLVLAHRVVVLVVAEFRTIRSVLVETVSGDGGHDFNTRGVRWHGEIQLSIVTRFVVCAIKLSAAKGVGGVDGPSSAAPIAEKERDGKSPLLAPAYLNRRSSPSFNMNKYGEISVNHMPSRP